jgi:hypothetical protein
VIARNGGPSPISLPLAALDELESRVGAPTIERDDLAETIAIRDPDAEDRRFNRPVHGVINNPVHYKVYKLSALGRSKRGLCSPSAPPVRGVEGMSTRVRRFEQEASRRPAGPSPRSPA